MKIVRYPSSRADDHVGAWFDPNTDYMPVPRCDQCRHWDKGNVSVGGNYRTCVEPTISPEQMDEFMTRADFGCVQWEAK